MLVIGSCIGVISGVRVPPFLRLQEPSFELKVRRNAWVAGVLPGTPMGELTARLRALLLKGRERRGGKVEGRGRGWKGKRGGEGRKGEGKWYSNFVEESYAPGQLVARRAGPSATADICHALFCRHVLHFTSVQNTNVMCTVCNLQQSGTMQQGTKYTNNCPV